MEMTKAWIPVLALLLATHLTFGFTILLCGMEIICLPCPPALPPQSCSKNEPSPMYENVFITLQELYKCELMRTHWLQGLEIHLNLAQTLRGIHWLLQLKVLKAGEVWLQA